MDHRLCRNCAVDLDRDDELGARALRAPTARARRVAVESAPRTLWNMPVNEWVQWRFADEVRLAVNVLTHEVFFGPPKS